VQGADLTRAAEIAVRHVAGEPSVLVACDGLPGCDLPDRPRKFMFDGVLPPSCSQMQVFEEVGLPVVNDCLSGINGTILAYGQTGSGKTYSLLHQGDAPEEAALLPRIAFYLFLCIARDTAFVYEVQASAMQVYNEEVFDILHKDFQTGPSYMSNIAVQDNGDAPGLTWVTCEDPEDMVNVFQRARETLIYAETKLNKASSRSHAMFQVRLTKRIRGRHQGFESARQVGCKRSSLVVVDLAGSERVKKSGAAGINFREAANINRSLLVLGNVMNALAKQLPHVPMRDSKLTRLLEDHLGGNCRTVLLLCASPEKEQVQETLTSLQFGARAMSVKVAAQVNYAGLIEVDATAVIEERRRDARLEGLRHAGQTPDAESAILKSNGNGRPLLVSPESIKRRVRPVRLNRGLSPQQARALQFSAQQAQQACWSWQMEAMRLKDDLTQLELGSRDEAEQLRLAAESAQELAREWEKKAKAEASFASETHEALAAQLQRVRRAQSELAESLGQIGSTTSELDAVRREADALRASTSRHVAAGIQLRQQVEQAEALVAEWQSRAEAGVRDWQARTEAAELSLEKAMTEVANAQDAAARGWMRRKWEGSDLALRTEELRKKSSALEAAEAEVLQLKAVLEERSMQLQQPPLRTDANAGLAATVEDEAGRAVKAESAADSAGQAESDADRAAKAEAEGVRKGLLEARAARALDAVAKAHNQGQAVAERAAKAEVDAELAAKSEAAGVRKGLLEARVALTLAGETEADRGSKVEADAERVAKAEAEADGVRKGLLEARMALALAGDPRAFRHQTSVSSGQSHREGLERTQMPGVAQAKGSVFADSQVNSPSLAGGFDIVLSKDPLAPVSLEASFEPGPAATMRPTAEWAEIVIRGLGIDPKADPVVFEAFAMVLKRPLPEGWGMYATESEQPFFWNKFTSISDWHHPDYELLVSALEVRKLALRQRDPSAYLQRAVQQVNAQDDGLAARLWTGPFLTEEKVRYWHNVAEGTSVWHDPWAEARRLQEIRLALLHVLLQDVEEKRRAAGTKPSTKAPSSPVHTAKESAPRPISRAVMEQMGAALLQEDALSRQVANSYALFTKGDRGVEVGSLRTETGEYAPPGVSAGWRSPPSRLAEMPSASPLGQSRGGVSGQPQGPLSAAGRHMIASGSAPALRAHT